MPIAIRNQLLMPLAGMRFTYLDRNGHVIKVEVTGVSETSVEYMFTNHDGKMSESSTKMHMWRQFVRMEDEIHKILNFSYDR